MVDAQFREPGRNRESQTESLATIHCKFSAFRRKRARSAALFVTGGRASRSGDPHGHPSRVRVIHRVVAERLPLFAAGERVRANTRPGRKYDEEGSSSCAPPTATSARPKEAPRRTRTFPARGRRTTPPERTRAMRDRVPRHPRHSRHRAPSSTWRSPRTDAWRVLCFRIFRVWTRSPPSRTPLPWTTTTRDVRSSPTATRRSRPARRRRGKARTAPARPTGSPRTPNPGARWNDSPSTCSTRTSATPSNDSKPSKVNRTKTKQTNPPRSRSTRRVRARSGGRRWWISTMRSAYTGTRTTV